jgi:hypothetical protein
MGRNLSISKIVVAAALLASVDAAHGHPLRLVEEAHRLVVLPLAVLDHELVLRVVGVNRELTPSAAPARVAEQPREGVLA